MEYLRISIGRDELVVRDLAVADIEHLVAYWRDASPEHLMMLGVSRQVLGTDSDIYNRLLRLVPSGDPSQDRRAFVFVKNGHVIGYMNWHLIGKGDAFPHLHFISSSVRSKGLGSLVLVRSFSVLMEHLSVERLHIQTRPTNVRINRLLEHIVGIKPEMRFVDQPDGGLAAPGILCCYTLSRAGTPPVIDPLDRFISPRGRPQDIAEQR